MQRFISAALGAAFCVWAIPSYAWSTDPAPAPPPMTTKQLNKASAKAAAAASVYSSVTVTDRRQVAAAPSFGGLSSGPCTGVSGGLSLGTLMFGGGLMGGGLDSQCTLRNNIAIVAPADPDLAREMMNDLDGVQDAKKRLGRQ